MHLELGQSTGDLFHVFCGQYKFGGFDVLLKVLDLARSGDRDDERLLGQQPCERQLRCCSVFSLRKLGDAIDKGFISGYVFRPEAVKSRTKIRFRIKLCLWIQLLREIAHANWTPRHEADSLAVGYESPSQFNREYKRFFGKPPMHDVLLDIGLPSLNGIEAAQRIRELSPKSKILFVSQETSSDLVQGALASGGSGYVLKMNARNELLTAVNAVLGGKRFVGAILGGNKFTDPRDEQTADRTRSEIVPPLLPQNARMTCRHEAGFYSDDRFALDDLTQFIGAALKAGNAPIVVATKSHRDSLLPRLQAYGLDIGTAIEQGDISR